MTDLSQLIREECERALPCICGAGPPGHPLEDCPLCARVRCADLLCPSCDYRGTVENFSKRVAAAVARDILAAPAEAPATTGFERSYERIVKRAEEIASGK